MSDEQNWRVLSEKVGFDHPFTKVMVQEVELHDGRVIPDWPFVYLRDYINVVVFNEAGEIMIMEGYKHGIGRSSWQILGGYIEAGEDPLEAAKRELVEEIGYGSDDWVELGSFVADANRYGSTGHFFVAYGAKQIAEPDYQDLEAFEMCWVSVDEARAGLGNGRFVSMGYAMPLALALLRHKAEG